MATESGVPHLQPSELGTREYWDKAYTEELINHLEDSNEEGTIWFSESGAEERILAFLEDLEIPGTTEPNVDNPNLRILDIGTGNGHLLFALKDDDWQAEMVGIDYSDTSIKLANQIKDSRRKANEAVDAGRINFEQWDLLKEEPAAWIKTGFDIVLDKGTFDAISLSDEIVEVNQKGCELYARKAQRLVKDGGFLLVTSCNWTEQELKNWFNVPELTVHSTIDFPHFLFGGIKGQAVSAVCFQRRHR